MVTKSKASKGPAGPPTVKLFLGIDDRKRIVSSIETLPESIRGKNVPRLVDLVEAALMENTHQLGDTPLPDHKSENALTANLEALSRAIGGMQPALDAVPANPRGDFEYWSQPFARAVYGMFPTAKHQHHAKLVIALKALAASLNAMQTSGSGASLQAVIRSGLERKSPRKKIDAAPDALEPVARLVRAVCFYLYESKLDVDLDWNPPEGTDRADNANLKPSSFATVLLVEVASAFGFDVDGRRLRTRLRDYAAVLRRKPIASDTRNFVEVGENLGKRRGLWRPPVIADLGGVMVQVMLADAEAAAAADQSN